LTVGELLDVVVEQGPLVDDDGLANGWCKKDVDGIVMVAAALVLTLNGGVMVW